ncbi:DUF2807 domain-containing protein [Brevundimonas sp.]|uniref:GIN domain-containing protein n=1 Tax=Brevundimonas sp. TaxID=1871086 RepID=UPI001A318F54|nr:DUF2807 domain-containing protein [Brevundimonas sp.]MBJ7486122.1 DUF2807 domain-containing protein [Brevundimonas sp.]
MTRTLLIIAGAAFVLALATLGGAAAIGGRDMAANGWEWTFPGHGDGGDETIRFERVGRDNGPSITRTLAWTGGSTLAVDLSADVTYVQGDQAGIVVTGPKSLADRVRLDGNRLTMSDSDNESYVVFGWSNDDRLSIVVTAPSVTTFDLLGSLDLDIRDYDQDTLDIDLSGSGEVTASGKTRALSVDINGSGEADLGALQTVDAMVDISGSGDATVAPTGRADLSISGSGDIDLTTRPATLNQTITGSGDISQR